MLRRASIAALPLVLAACDYQQYQSTFGNAAVEARQFNMLFVIFLVICAIMYLLVIGFLLAGIFRSRRADRANVIEEGRHHESDPLMSTALVTWAGLIGVGLVALAVASFFADRSMASAAAQPKLSLTITANQWWWDVQYNASDLSKSFHTANELHLPAGVPVHILL
ncbi:MAG: hypothetical protein ACJ8FO_10840, partial [Sphingomicrobium sp.]